MQCLLNPLPRGVIAIARLQRSVLGIGTQPIGHVITEPALSMTVAEQIATRVIGQRLAKIFK